MIDFGLYLTYFLLIVAALLALVFPLKYMLQHPGEAKSVFIGLGVLAAIVIVGYVTSSSDFYFKGIENFNITANGIKLVGAGLNTFYILLAITVLSVIYFEAIKLVK
jgi:hypothetical protein